MLSTLFAALLVLAAPQQPETIPDVWPLTQPPVASFVDNFDFDIEGCEFVRPDEVICWNEEDETCGIHVRYTDPLGNRQTWWAEKDCDGLNIAYRVDTDNDGTDDAWYYPYGLTLIGGPEALMGGHRDVSDMPPSCVGMLSPNPSTWIPTWPRDTGTNIDNYNVYEAPESLIHWYQPYGCCRAGLSDNYICADGIGQGNPTICGMIYTHVEPDDNGDDMLVSTWFERDCPELAPRQIQWMWDDDGDGWWDWDKFNGNKVFQDYEPYNPSKH